MRQFSTGPIWHGGRCTPGCLGVLIYWTWSSSRPCCSWRSQHGSWKAKGVDGLLGRLAPDNYIHSICTWCCNWWDINLYASTSILASSAAAGKKLSDPADWCHLLLFWFVGEMCLLWRHPCPHWSFSSLLHLEQLARVTANWWLLKRGGR